jgi:nucleoside-diphosphate-sugar epimerase/predicted dehydrogenase
LAGHEGVRVAALVDRDMSRARELAKSYGVTTVVADAGELPAGSIDAAVVATPPFHHASCCVELSRRGAHVLVEKPMAVTIGDARAMVEAAREAGVVLSAGYFRRLFPAVGLLRASLDAGALGEVIGFDAEEGDVYTWGLATLSNLRKDQGGGGVLIDIGSHVLDLLLYLFPGEFEVLGYRDNALGGIETDCLLRLRLWREGRSVEGRVELSRTRRLRSSLRVRCERGTLELRTGERFKLNIIPEGVQLCDPDGEEVRPIRVEASWADQPESVGYEAYRAEIDDWLQAIRDGSTPRLDAKSALRTVELIDQCYRQAGRLDEPWTWGGALFKKDERLPAEASRSRGRVLITGASGFIGCRTAEVLQLGEGWQVRGLVHRPSSAARLARLPVEMVQGDLRSAEDMTRAVAGCDAVVHCAIGTAYGQRSEIFAVTVGGTRNLVEAAQRAGVKRFVHLSSIAVHGLNVEGLIDESTPVAPTRGDDYSESKAAAEAIVQASAKAGLPVVIIRPGNVYGPFSQTFSIRPIQYLKRGNLILVGCSEDPSNTVYVDNLVHAVCRSLDAPMEVANGKVFTISDGDELSWGEFYGFFARELGAALQTQPSDDPKRNRPKRGLGRWFRHWWHRSADVIRSAEFRALGKKVLNEHPVGKFPRWVLERSPWLDRKVRKLVGTEAVMVYRRPTPVPDDLMKVRRRSGLVCIKRACRLLGYEPPSSREKALQLTLAWIRNSRVA